MINRPSSLIIVLLALLWTSSVLAAPCSQTDYILSTQARVDALGQTGCTVISGDLSIKNSSDITNLDALKNITHVRGYISIRDNVALTNLDGLINVSQVGHYLWVGRNTALRNCEGLASVLGAHKGRQTLQESCLPLGRETVQAEKARERIRAREEAAKLQADRERELAAAEAAQSRLQACDSFGFQRGTDAHAQCAMQLYINEQNQATSSKASTQQRGQRQADLEQQKRAQEALLASQRQQIARQEAIQEAILKEQERVRRMEQSMKLIELGTGIATGSLGGSPNSTMQSHTYTINGQIINCTTTGSVTNCF